MDSDVMEELQYLNAGGFTYAYRRYGDYEAPAVVLLMGLGLSMEAWPEGIISGLLAEGFQVITPDNRDVGASFRFTGWQPGRGDVARAIVRTVLGLSVTGEYALEDMALDIERLLDHLGILIRQCHRTKRHTDHLKPTKLLPLGRKYLIHGILQLRIMSHNLIRTHLPSESDCDS